MNIRPTAILSKLGFDTSYCEVESKHCKIFMIPGDNDAERRALYRQAEEAIDASNDYRENTVLTCEPLGDPPRIRVKITKDR